MLWSEIVKVGWAARLDDVVRSAAPYVLAMNWTPEVDFEMVILQVG